MTLRRIRRLSPILLAIVLTGIVERRSCAQSSGQSPQADRRAVTLEPPPQYPSRANGESKRAKAPSVRIALEMAPPAKKLTDLEPPAPWTPAPWTPAPWTPATRLPATKPAAPDAASVKPPVWRQAERKVEELTAPPSLTDSFQTLHPSELVPKGTALNGLPHGDTALHKTTAAEPLGPSQTFSRIQLPQTPTPEEIPAPQLAVSQLEAPQSEASQLQAARPDALVHLGAPEQIAAPDPTAEPKPALVAPYWVSAVLEISASGQPNTQPILFDEAIWDALAHSPYVKAVLTVPMINQAKISEASGIFDQTPFVDSIFNDTSDPAGSTLTTGGPNRLNETRLDNAVGVRSKNRLGGTAELAQNIQLRNNNSVFLSPKEQADAKLLLRLNQPLMRGAGRTYTTSSLRIAEFNAGVAEHEAMRKLQLHCDAIASAYWNLFAARAIEMQAQRGIERLVYLREELLKRAEVDGLQSQLLRAEAAIARQNATRARAQADVASAEAMLRALVNSPKLSDGPRMLMPATPPCNEPFVIDKTSQLQAALAFHPNVLAARDRIKAATTRLKVAENELRPTLNLVMEGYLHGLNGDYGLGDSMADQFSRGRPSYSGGVNYQRPYRNIVSKAILRERRLELRQLLLELDNSLLTVMAEVEQAIEAVKYTYAELQASAQSTLAFDAEVRYLNGRWQNAFVETTQPSLLLDELLNAQNQLIQAENSWARAQAEHMIAFTRLHVATGTLLNSIPIPADE